MFKKTSSRYNLRNNKKSLRKTNYKANYIRKKAQKGGAVNEYMPESPQTTPFVASLLKAFIKNSCPSFNSITWPSAAAGKYQEGSPTLYLAGYDKFIGPHKLLPLYKKGVLTGPAGWISSGSGQQLRSTISDSGIDQAYYYLTPFVYDNFIITRTLDGITSQEYGDTPSLHLFTGYNGVQPNLTFEYITPPANRTQPTWAAIVNKDIPYNDKFLFFPQGTNKSYILFSFMPRLEDDNVYDVKGIGKVILNKPANDEPWYGKKIVIMFEPDYVPPEIISSSEAPTEAPLTTEAPPPPTPAPPDKEITTDHDDIPSYCFHNVGKHLLDESASPACHPEDVFESLQMSAIYNDPYTYPELIFQDNVALYEKLIEYGKYHLTNHAIGTYAHPRNLYLCIFLNRPKIFKLLYNSFYRDHFIEGSENFQSLNKLEGIRNYFSPKVNPDKKVFDFIEPIDELLSMRKTPTSSFFFTKQSGGLFWEVIFALGRIDILNVVKDDILLVKTKMRENLLIIPGSGSLRTLDVFVPKGKEGDEMVELMKMAFLITHQEITRFDLPDTLLESSINKKLTDSRSK